MMQTLTVRELARVLVAARVELLSAESTLNTLNVFPVPDGDTGTNMRMTLEAGLTALGDPDATDDERAALRRVVAAMTRGAQGNSGVILSEYVRGFVREITSWKRLTSGTRGLEFSGDALACALAGAASSARGAVHDPVDGTILSVADQAARASGHLVDEAQHAGAEVGVGAVAQVAFDAARAALERTPEQLEVLAHSNVIDAGAAGLVLVLESLARVTAGRAGLPRVSERSWLRPRAGGALHDVGGCHVAPGGPAFELICAADGLDEGAAAGLRAELSGLGDSVVVAGGDGVHRVHVHTDRVLAAVSSVRSRALTSDLKVTRFTAVPASLPPVVVVARDEAVRAYAGALGAQVRDGSGRPAAHASSTAQGESSGDDLTPMTVLSDAPEPDGAASHHLIGLIDALDGRAAAAAMADLDGTGGSGSGASASNEALALPDGGASMLDGLFDDELDDGEVEVLRADSWRAARDLVRLHASDAESVVLCVDPAAQAHAVHEVVELLRAHASAADVAVLRLDAGSLVLMQVTHG